ncbi:MAG: FkbM family methyltransferase [Pseudomonadota bacterium]
MTDRLIPKAFRPTPINLFEFAMSQGTKLPGRLGYLCDRKLKRRLRKRMQGPFLDVLADTGAGDLCLDLGANQGEFTRKLAETGADVIAFEPDPVAYAVLEANCGSLDNVTLHKKAVSTEDTQMMLRRTANWTDKNALKRSVSSSIVHNDAGMSDAHGEMVDVVDLLRFMTELDRNIRIIKMDVEGAEWDILQALLDHPVLDRIDCMFVETHQRCDPARCIPLFNDLENRALALDRPYINLYWV